MYVLHSDRSSRSRLRVFLYQEENRERRDEVVSRKGNFPFFEMFKSERTLSDGILLGPKLSKFLDKVLRNTIGGGKDLMSERQVGGVELYSVGGIGSIGFWRRERGDN